MKTPDTTPVQVALDGGIDLSSRSATRPGLRRLTNLEYGANGEVRPRRGFRLDADNATVCIPGGIVPMDGTVRAHSAYDRPLDVVVGRVYSGGGSRMIQAMHAPGGAYTAVVRVLREETPTNLAGTVAPSTLMCAIYASDGTLLAQEEITGPGTPQDVKLTSGEVSATGTGDGKWLVTYVDYTGTDTLSAHLITYDIGGLSIGTAVTLHTSVNQTASSSQHVVEFDPVNLRWVVFTTTTVIAYSTVTLAGVATNNTTAYLAGIYAEMGSCATSDYMCVVTTESTGFAVMYTYRWSTGVIAALVTPALVAATTGHVAVVPHGTGSVVMLRDVGAGPLSTLPTGVHMWHGSITGGFSTPGADVLYYGAVLADCGSSVYEDDGAGSTVQTGVVGLTSADALGTNFRSHVLVRMFIDGSQPFLRLGAVLAHSDAGVWQARSLNFAGNVAGRTPSLPRWVRQSATEIELPVPIVTRSTADEGSLTVGTWPPLDKFARDARVTRVISNVHTHRGLAQLGPNTYAGGAVPTSWDGRILSPAGFLIPPKAAETAVSGISPSPSTAFADGTYDYYIRTSYIDARGTVFDSPLVHAGYSEYEVASSSVCDVTFWGGAIWPPDTLDTGEPGSFRTQVFRNADALESGGAIYNSHVAQTHQAAGDAYTYTDETGRSFATNELMPNPNGGPLTGTPLPALRHLWAHRSRLFGVDFFDPEVVRFTTEYVAPTAPLWDDVLAFRVTNSGGPVVGGASLGDRFVLFQANQFCVVSGEGPDALGAGSFGLPEAIRGVGCRVGGQGSIVEVPTGVVFAHTSGIHHLGFDLTLTPIGEKLHGRLADTNQPLPEIPRAAYLPSRGQVWFLTNGDAMGELGNPHILVWDVIRSRWTTFESNLGPFHDVTEHDGVVWLQSETGELVEALDVLGAHDMFGDEPNVFPLGLQDAELRLDDAHEMRVRKVHLSGTGENTSSDVTLIVTTYSERRGGGSEETARSFDFDLDAFGSKFQLPARAATQRCTSATVEVYITPDTDYDNDFTLANLTYEVSPMAGTGKVPVEKKPAVS